MTSIIPNRLIFVWVGKSLPWSCQLAVKSAVAQCGAQGVLLLHKGLSGWLKDNKPFADNFLTGHEEYNSQWFQRLPVSDKLASELYHNLTAPAAIANILRLAALYTEGGVYLDGDTITVADLKPLRHHQGFCGLEPLALPAGLFKSRNPFSWGAAGVRLGFRDICTRLPHGYKYFRFAERLYHGCVNNAVIGSVPGNPVIERACKLIEQMSPGDRLKRFRLGTHLLQQVTGNISSADMSVLPQEYFYPLGPEVSSHWFRPQPKGAIDRMLGVNTKVVHWYHSVEKRFLKQAFNKEYVLANPHLPISQLAMPYVYD